jgi:hypothetical protein
VVKKKGNTKQRKNKISPAKGWFSAVTQNLEPTKKTPREMVSLCYWSKVRLIVEIVAQEGTYLLLQYKQLKRNT